MNRRGFLRLGLAALAAPAIIRASNLMAVKPPWPDLVIIDDPWAAYPDLYARHLAMAFRQTKELVATNVLNRSFRANEFFT